MKVSLSCSEEAKPKGRPRRTSNAPHPADRAMPDIFEFSAHGLARQHGDVRVSAFEGLDAGLLVDADDVLARRCLVVDAQNVVALLAELLVMRSQVHLLPLRLQVGVAQDTSYGAVARLDALTAYVFAEERRRPVRDRKPYIARRPAGLAFDLCRIRLREREGGRPE